MEIFVFCSFIRSFVYLFVYFIFSELLIFTVIASRSASSLKAFGNAISFLSIGSLATIFAVHSFSENRGRRVLREAVDKHAQANAQIYVRVCVFEHAFI